MDEREIERLVETHPSADLEAAEEDLIQGKKVKITVAGESPGQKLAYIAAAKWIVERIQLYHGDFKTALEAYQQEIKGQ